MPATVTAPIIVSTGSNELSGVHVGCKYDELYYRSFRRGQCHDSSEECTNLIAAHDSLQS